MDCGRRFGIEGWCDPLKQEQKGLLVTISGFTAHRSISGIEYHSNHGEKKPNFTATIVGQTPMEDGYLGEAIGKQFTPVLNFQHRDVLGVHLPWKRLHNLAIVQSKQRFRQARKTCLGLMAPMMMFLKIMIAVDSKPDDLHTL